MAEIFETQVNVTQIEYELNKIAPKTNPIKLRLENFRYKLTQYDIIRTRNNWTRHTPKESNESKLSLNGIANI